MFHLGQKQKNPQKMHSSEPLVTLVLPKVKDTCSAWQLVRTGILHRFIIYITDISNKSTLSNLEIRNSWKIYFPFKSSPVTKSYIWRNMNVWTSSSSSKCSQQVTLWPKIMHFSSKSLLDHKYTFTSSPPKFPQEKSLFTAFPFNPHSHWLQIVSVRRTAEVQRKGYHGQKFL